MADEVGEHCSLAQWTRNGNRRQKNRRLGNGGEGQDASASERCNGALASLIRKPQVHKAQANYLIS
jgi:hypothetical protein